MTEPTYVNPWVGGKLARVNPNWLDEHRDELMAKHDTKDDHFAMWLEMVDIVVRTRTMMSYRDLEDWDFWSSYSSDVSPLDAVNDMFEELGIELGDM